MIPTGTESCRPFLPAKDFDRIMVDDLDAWWTHVEALGLPAAFGVQPPKAPAVQPWGLRVAYVYDPAGVLWHVAERRPDLAHDR